MKEDARIQNDYRNNRVFREYVDKYCAKHGCRIEEAFRHERVRQINRYYTEV